MRLTTDSQQVTEWAELYQRLAGKLLKQYRPIAKAACVLP